MNINVETLGTFYEMARQGGGLAADRLTRMTGVESRVEGTRIEFSSTDRVIEQLRTDDDYAGAVVELSGGIEGKSIIVFEEHDAIDHASDLVRAVDGDAELIPSAIREVCGVMNAGFVDGWANVLGRDIDISIPQYVSSSTASENLANTGGEFALLFRSRIAMEDDSSSFRHYFVPSEATVEELFASSTGIDYRNLVGFDQVAQEGVDRVTDDLTALTGMQTELEVHGVNFLALDAIPEAVPNERMASVAFSFDGPPSGYLLFLYNEYSARTMAETMVPSGEADFDGLARDALQEASNIMASGFLDGWANALETTIEHTTPAFAWEFGPSAVDPLIVALSESQEFAFVFDTKMTAADDEFDLSVYVIPDERELDEVIAEVGTGDATDVETRPEIELDGTRETDGSIEGVSTQ